MATVTHARTFGGSSLSSEPGRVCGKAAATPRRAADGGSAVRVDTASRRNDVKGIAMITKRKFFEYGGIVASLVLVAFGVAAIVLGLNGRSTVHTNLAAEQIVGTPDMTPSAIGAEAAQAGL